MPGRLPNRGIVAALQLVFAGQEEIDHLLTDFDLDRPQPQPPEDGKVEQTNFDGYQVLRIDEMPKVEVHIVPSLEAPTGVGEPGVAPIGPAIANAVLAATGKRLRILPFAVGGTA